VQGYRGQPARDHRGGGRRRRLIGHGARSPQRRCRSHRKRNGWRSFCTTPVRISVHGPILIRCCGNVDKRFANGTREQGRGGFGPAPHRPDVSRKRTGINGTLRRAISSSSPSA
jgi:hypothetical protein